MESRTSSPRTDPSSDRGKPEQLIYRRRRTDWLSGAFTAEAPSDEPETVARRAAIELAKATLIARDGLTSDHSDDVGLLCEAIAEQFHLEDQERSDLTAAAQLHDIGKVGVPESILQKPGPLTASEWKVMRQHTLTGERILNAVPELREVAVIVRHSHEHWDGSGYPDGLAGEENPLASRIILCADAFHAVRSPRPYRSGRSAREALEEIQANSGGQFDPAVVAALERTVEDVRGARPWASRLIPTRAMLGSRRLAVLLLAIAVAGSAFAASRWDEGRAVAGSATGCVESCSSSPPSVPGVAPSGARSSRPSVPGVAPTGARSARTAARRARRRAAEPRRSPRRSHGGPAIRRPRPRVKARPETRTGPSRPGPNNTSGAQPPETLPRAGGQPAPATGPAGGIQGPRATGHAYGHEKRLLSPQPPKPPPGRIKPKPNP